MSHWTAICPPEPSAMMALLARTFCTAKLMALEMGAGLPAGYSRRSPKSVSPTTVTMRAIAVAVDGIPQMPVTGKLWIVLAPSAGRPEGRTELRVSATRQGVTVKKFEALESKILATKTLRFPPFAAWRGLAVGKLVENVSPMT